MANGNPFNQKLGGILEETKKEREEREERELELRAQKLREQFDVSEPMGVPARDPDANEFEAPVFDPNAGMQGGQLPGKLTEPLPVPEPPPELTWEDMTRPQKKKFDKLKLEKEDAVRDANSALIMATARGDALEKYMAKIREKHPRPSGWERGLAMATGGITGAATGMFSRGRKADAEEKAGRVRFAEEWERIQDSAAKAKTSRASRSASTISQTDRDNMSEINNKMWLLRDYLPEDWGEGTGLSGNKATYPQQIKHLQFEMFSGVKGKGKRKAPVNPRVLSVVGAIADRLADYEKVQDERKKNWRDLAAANVTPSGGFTPEFVARMEEDHPDAMIEAMKGALEPIKASAASGVQDWGKHGSTARANIAVILQGMGHTKEESLKEVEEMLRTPSDKRMWVSEDSLDYLRDSVSALAEHKALTGTTYTRNPENELKIMQLDRRREWIKDALWGKRGLQGADGLSKKEKDKLKESYIKNQQERAGLVMETFLVDPAEVRTAIDIFKANRSDRKAQVNSLKAIAAKDLSAAMTIVGGELYDKKGGDETFTEKVFLNAKHKVVKFDPDKHKDQERFSFKRIKPSKQRDLLSYRAKQTVIGRDTLGVPETIMTERTPVLEDVPEADRPILMLTKADREFIKGVSGIDLNMGTEVSRVGRLIKGGRERILKWLDSDRAAEALAASPDNFEVFRRGLTPETIDLDFLGGGDLQKGKEIWDGIKDVETLKRMLRRADSREPEAAGKPREVSISDLPANTQKKIKGMVPGNLYNHPDGSSWKVVGDKLIEVIR